MTSSNSILSSRYLRECFDYKEKTGQLIWKTRPRKHFKDQRACNAFNVWAGKKAGTLRKIPKSNQKYLVIIIKGEPYFAHRLVWIYHNDYIPNVIDHIDGNGSNNRIENLRDVDNAENSKNQKLSKNNKSGVLGVTRVNGKWVAKIMEDGKAKHLGSYASFNDAVIVRKMAEYEKGYHPNHGER